MQRRTSLALIAGAFAMVTQLASSQTAPAQTTSPAQKPTYETRFVDGTNNVYIFRHGNVQAMCVVTPAGVIAPDPSAMHGAMFLNIYLAHSSCGSRSSASCSQST
jgi:hypothetical protein